MGGLEPIASSASYHPLTTVIEEQAESAAQLSPEATDVASSTAPAAAVQRWLAEHGDVLWRFALGRTRTREAAEEVVQETVLAAMQAHGTFAGGSSERTWLLGIAAHKIADHFRAARRRDMESDPTSGTPDRDDKSEFHGMFTATGMWAKQPKTWGLDAGSTAENAEMLASLRRCIEELPPAQAEAVWLRDILSIPSDEVCKSMGISPTNLWSRMHRARASLRACVEKSMGMSKEDTR